jgi:hypothetical protein
MFGSRVVPVFAAIGRNLELLGSVGGLTKRAKRLVGPERRQPNGGIFELLVAAAYRRAGGDVACDEEPGVSRRRTTPPPGSVTAQPASASADANIRAQPQAVVVISLGAWMPRVNFEAESTTGLACSLLPFATGFATQLDGTSWYGERYQNEESRRFQDGAGTPEPLP